MTASQGIQFANGMSGDYICVKGLTASENLYVKGTI
jgi:hypothetical protein